MLFEELGKPGRANPADCCCKRRVVLASNAQVAHGVGAFTGPVPADFTESAAGCPGPDKVTPHRAELAIDSIVPCTIFAWRTKIAVDKSRDVCKSPRAAVCASPSGAGTSGVGCGSAFARRASGMSADGVHAPVHASWAQFACSCCRRHGELVAVSARTAEARADGSRAWRRREASGNARLAFISIEAIFVVVKARRALLASDRSPEVCLFRGLARRARKAPRVAGFAG